jgi:hypothetical protein
MPRPFLLEKRCDGIYKPVWEDRVGRATKALVEKKFLKSLSLTTIDNFQRYRGYFAEPAGVKQISEEELLHPAPVIVPAFPPRASVGVPELPKGGLPMGNLCRVSSILGNGSAGE